MADPGRLDELKRKFEENPKRYFAPLANEYRKAGDPELAIELCRTYLPQQPTHMSGYIVYGQALHDAGHADESAAVFKQALTLDPENIIALLHLGDISRAAGDKVNAMRWYGKVLELDPRNEEIAAYITSLAQPGSTTATPVAARQAPPSVRPEPEHDESAVRLEDIFAQPDVAQMPFVADEGGAEQPHATTDDPSDEPLEATAWPTAGEAGATGAVAPQEGSEPSPVLEGPWHAATPPEETSADYMETTEESSTPLHLSDFMPDEDAAFAPTPEELGQAPADSHPESRTEPQPDSQPDSHPEQAAAHADAPVAPLPAANADESPFVTETMAELYVKQGLRGEALGIYRQLALKRDDPKLRQRVAELEAEQSAAATGETVRAFFARIGAKRSAERVELAVDRNSPLAALFGSGPPDAGDLSAAQRLSGAFGTSRSSDSHS